MKCLKCLELVKIGVRFGLIFFGYRVKVSILKLQLWLGSKSSSDSVVKVLNLKPSEPGADFPRHPYQPLVVSRQASPPDKFQTSRLHVTCPSLRNERVHAAKKRA